MPIPTQELAELVAIEKELTIVAAASVARARAAARSEQVAVRNSDACIKRAADTREAAIVDLTARDAARRNLAAVIR